MSDKYGDKYRVYNWVKFDYSEIGEYIGENYTDKPLRNDEIVDLLNEQGNEIQRCKLAYAQLASYVDANFDEYMTQEKLNEQIKELESCNHGLAQKQKRKLTKIIELEKELNEKNERIKELETELANMTQRFEYELQMKLKYHSKLIECEKKGDTE